MRNPASSAVPPIGTTAAYPPAGTTVLEPKPAGTPSCAYPPMTAMRAGESGRNGNNPRLVSSTMPCRAMRKAMSLWAFRSGAGARSDRSTPTAKMERRMRRTMSESRSLGNRPSA